MGTPITLIEAFPGLAPRPSPSPHPGTFFQDTELGGAYGCTELEAAILDALITVVKPVRVLEIGSYVGWSSAHLAFSLNGTLDCIDALTERAGSLGNPDERVAARFHENIARANLTEKVTLHIGTSPEIIPEVAQGQPWDFIFLDGWHFDGQPLDDVQGILPWTHEKTVIVLHDLWIPDVQNAWSYLVEQGWSYEALETPGKLTVLWRDKPRWRSAFRRMTAGWYE